MRHRLIAPFLLTLAALPAGAQSVRLVEAGIDCPDEAVVERVPAPGTAAGYVDIVEGLALDARGRRLPMEIGYGMGIATRLKGGLAPVAVTMTTTHPPMGPEGVTRQTYETTLVPGDDHLRVYRLDYDYELVPGRWTLGVEIDGTPQLSVAFEVVDGPVPGMELLCLEGLSS